jgi:hypothetical protein
MPPTIRSMAIEYAKAKTAYFKALRKEVPELTNIATGRQARPPELDKFATTFAIAGEKQETVADQKTMIFLKRFSDNSDAEKAREKFECAQKAEEQFHKEFDGQDFTIYSLKRESDKTAVFSDCRGSALKLGAKAS